VFHQSKGQDAELLHSATYAFQRQLCSYLGHINFSKSDESRGCMLAQQAERQLWVGQRHPQPKAAIRSLTMIAMAKVLYPSGNPVWLIV
jgi:hypothetical protein